MAGYRAALFDFDGVILDTVQLKIDAFVDVYQKEAPEKQEAVRSCAEAHGGLSRFQKFAYFEASIFSRKGDADTVELLCRRYGEFVDTGIALAHFIAGAPACFPALQNL